MGLLSTIAKFLNWPMEMLGKAREVLKGIGGFILDGIKQLGSMVKDAASGVLHEVIGAFRDIATKLREFADELLAKFGKSAKGDADAAGDAGKSLGDEGSNLGDGANDGATDGQGNGGQSALDKEAQKAEEMEEALAVARAIAKAEDAGHIPGPGIAASLIPLKGRYSWIKTFEAELSGLRYAIYMIASKTKTYATEPDPVNRIIEALGEDEYWRLVKRVGGPENLKMLSVDFQDPAELKALVDAFSGPSQNVTSTAFTKMLGDGMSGRDIKMLVDRVGGDALGPIAFDVGGDAKRIIDKFGDKFVKDMAPLGGEGYLKLEKWDCFTFNSGQKRLIDMRGFKVKNLPSLAGKTQAEVEAELRSRGFQFLEEERGMRVWGDPDGSLVKIKIGEGAKGGRTEDHFDKEILRPTKGDKDWKKDWQNTANTMAKLTDDNMIIPEGVNMAYEDLRNFFWGYSRPQKWPTEFQWDTLKDLWAKAGHLPLG
jgi:hypothetical protein